MVNFPLVILNMATCHMIPYILDEGGSNQQILSLLLLMVHVTSKIALKIVGRHYKSS